MSVFVMLSVNSLRQQAISSSCTLLFKSLGMVRLLTVLESLMLTKAAFI